MMDLGTDLCVALPNLVRHLGEVVDRARQVQAQEDSGKDGERRERERPSRKSSSERVDRLCFLRRIYLHDDAPAEIVQIARRGPHGVAAIVHRALVDHGIDAGNGQIRRVYASPGPCAVLHRTRCGLAGVTRAPRVARRVEYAVRISLPHHDERLTGRAESRGIARHLREVFRRETGLQPADKPRWLERERHHVVRVRDTGFDLKAKKSRHVVTGRRLCRFEGRRAIGGGRARGDLLPFRTVDDQGSHHRDRMSGVLQDSVNPGTARLRPRTSEFGQVEPQLGAAPDQSHAINPAARHVFQLLLAALGQGVQLPKQTGAEQNLRVRIGKRSQRRHTRERHADESEDELGADIHQGNLAPCCRFLMVMSPKHLRSQGPSRSRAGYRSPHRCEPKSRAAGHHPTRDRPEGSARPFDGRRD